MNPRRTIFYDSPIMDARTEVYRAVAADIARRAYDLLASFPVPVLILPGNHDPLQAGSVWDVAPWREMSATSSTVVRVLRDRTPLEIVTGVTIFPCPVLRKTSHDNP